MASASSFTSAPVASHSSAIALMKEIFVARNELAAVLTISAVAWSVMTCGMPSASKDAYTSSSSCRARSPSGPDGSP